MAATRLLQQQAACWLLQGAVLSTSSMEKLHQVTKAAAARAALKPDLRLAGFAHTAQQLEGGTSDQSAASSGR